ncbi:MAG: hypothetical protein ABI240_12630, partial [Sphingomonas sp.]
GQIAWVPQPFSPMLAPGNTSPCHDPLHLFAKMAESQHTRIAQQLSDQALNVIPAILMGNSAAPDCVATATGRNGRFGWAHPIAVSSLTMDLPGRLSSRDSAC